MPQGLLRFSLQHCCTVFCRMGPVSLGNSDRQLEMIIRALVGVPDPARVKAAEARMEDRWGRWDGRYSGAHATNYRRGRDIIRDS